jgi:hypothetical protein
MKGKLEIAKSLSPRWMRTALLLTAGLAVAGAWAARSSGPVAEQPAGRKHVAAMSQPKATAAAKAAEWRFDAVIERNLFMPATVAAVAAVAHVPPPPILPINPTAFQSQPAPRWIYAGYATVDGAPMAIVENSSTKQAEFISVGGRLDGGTVETITPQAIRVTRNGETTEMAISTAFTATPLNAPPQPAATNQRGGRRGNMNNAAGAAGATGATGATGAAGAAGATGVTGAPGAADTNNNPFPGGFMPPFFGGFGPGMAPGGD